MYCSTVHIWIPYIGLDLEQFAEEIVCLFLFITGCKGPMSPLKLNQGINSAHRKFDYLKLPKLEGRDGREKETSAALNLQAHICCLWSSQEKTFPLRAAQTTNSYIYFSNNNFHTNWFRNKLMSLISGIRWASVIFFCNIFRQNWQRRSLKKYE